ncbi:hypothetical protein [Paenibacillus alba]|uniref:Uncharacterized protein n=1 Tax=Paenibacillus alba TaxID=1197127 RepID=A0ABU6FWH0_9BACL|nr:hypothetical protein [Paenibacillus alba]MEC0226247.1 hypothetical protein [Paenibacillus alba]
MEEAVETIVHAVRTVSNLVGIEPANCHVGGRKEERERGTWVYLEPGEILMHLRSLKKTYIKVYMGT